MIIEFFGFPAVGKTTFQERCIREQCFLCEGMVTPVILKEEISKPERLKVVLFVVANPRLLYIVLKLCWSCRSGGIDTLRYTYRFLMKIYMMKSALSWQRNYLCDELGIQAVWSIFIKSRIVNHRLIEEILNYLKPMYCKAKLIYIEDNSYDVVRYIGERKWGTSRFDSFSDSEKRYYITTGKHVMDWILYYMRELDYPLEVYEVNRFEK